ncbi:MAG: hypothetical protein K9M54_03705 [Kiritimatiellales bacterium]|nr:hypothetical protein [Kiritimatiellales bacterium]
MGFTLEKVVPWGRSFDEYVAMFTLSETDLAGRILGCGDGPAAFNAVLTKRGGNVVSFDPLYRFSPQDIRRRIMETYPEVMRQTRANKEKFIWTQMKTVEELGQIRMAAMESFLADYQHGADRYVAGELPRLPFSTGQFDLAVCSHLLFLYSEQLSEDFHIESIEELCRVAGEVRIFPLLELGSKPSRHLPVVENRLKEAGYAVSITPVPYEFQRGGNQMMSIKPNEPSE